MQCSEAQDLLVALDDDELSPSARRLLTDHVQRCPECAELQRALSEATPRPFLHPPPHIEARLDEVTDPGRILAAAARPPRRRPFGPGLWLAGDAHVPRSMVVGYGMLLAATFAWGLANWYTAASMAQPGGALAAPTQASEIPAEQYRPASYRPGEADFP